MCAIDPKEPMAFPQERPLHVSSMVDTTGPFVPIWLLAHGNTRSQGDLAAAFLRRQNPHQESDGLVLLRDWRS